MRIIKEKIFESPDYVCLSGKYSAYSIRQCKDKRTKQLSWRIGYGFGYENGKFYLTGGTHSDVGSDRNSSKYPGRIWPDAKVISFWKYPAPSRIKKVIKDLERELELRDFKPKIWDDPKWKIEVIVTSKPRNKSGKYDGDYGSGDYPGDLKWNRSAIISEFIHPKEYAQRSNIQQRDKEEIEQEHEISPLLKKKRYVPSDVGSKRYASRRPLAWSQKLYQESYKAKHVYEAIEFERGLEPAEAMGIGKGITKNVPQELKDLGFNYNDTRDNCYLDDYPMPTMFFGYTNADDVYRGDEFGKFYQIYTDKYDKRHSDRGTIALTWFEISVENLKILFSEELDYQQYKLKKIYEVEGEEGVKEWINNLFSIKPDDIGFFNFR